MKDPPLQHVKVQDMFGMSLLRSSTLEWRRMHESRLSSDVYLLQTVSAPVLPKMQLYQDNRYPQTKLSDSLQFSTRNVYCLLESDAEHSELYSESPVLLLVRIGAWIVSVVQGLVVEEACEGPKKKQCGDLFLQDASGC